MWLFKLVVISNWWIGTPPVIILFSRCKFGESFFDFASTNLIILLQNLTLEESLASTRAYHHLLETLLAFFLVSMLYLMKCQMNFFLHFSSFPVSFLCPQGKAVFDVVYLQTPSLNCCSLLVFLLFLIWRNLNCQINLFKLFIFDEFQQHSNLHAFKN